MAITTIPAAVVRTNRILKNVYLWMSGGLALTGLVALYVVSNERLIQTIVANRGLLFVLIIAELALVLFMSTRILRMQPRTATMCFALYAILNGVVLAPIFLIYTRSSIATTFLVTGGLFGAMSIWALTTTRDLSRWGPYLFWGIIGIVAASLLNFFLRSSGLDYLISIIGVVLFMALTAYDTQMIRRWDEQLSGSDEATFLRISILGALKLYLDFINIFLFLLRFLGRRQ